MAIQADLLASSRAREVVLPSSRMHPIRVPPIDPAKVARLALQNAASISSLLLTTETLVSEQAEETSPEPPHEHTGFSHGGHV